MLTTLATSIGLIGSSIAILRYVFAAISPGALANRIRSDLDLRELHLRNADDVEDLGFSDFAAEYRREADRVVPLRLITYLHNRRDRGRQALWLVAWASFSLLCLIYLIASLTPRHLQTLTLVALALGAVLIISTPLCAVAQLRSHRRIRSAVDEHLEGASDLRLELENG